jgi:large subunit ribosomal protein L10
MRPEKQAIVAEIRGKLDGSAYVILADCRGLNVEQLKDLRGQLRGQEALLTVVPNAMFRLAARELGWDGLEGLLSGPTAMLSGRGDICRVAKTLQAFAKETTLPVVKGGRLQGQVLTAADVDVLAGLPARDVLIGQVVGTLAAPLTRLVGVMSRKVSSLLTVLNAVAEQKGRSQ